MHERFGSSDPGATAGADRPPAHPTARADLGRLRLRLSTIERLGTLAARVDRAAATSPLNGHPVLRAQMRRAAIDALTHAACDLELASPRDHRDLMLRTLASLGELDACARLAVKSGALERADVEHMTRLIDFTSEAVRANLDQHGSTLRGAA